MNTRQLLRLSGFSVHINEVRKKIKEKHLPACHVEKMTRIKCIIVMGNIFKKKERKKEEADGLGGGKSVAGRVIFRQTATNTSTFLNCVLQRHQSAHWWPSPVLSCWPTVALEKNNLDDPVTRSTSQLSTDEEGKGASAGSFFTLDLLYLERSASIFVLPYSDFVAKWAKKKTLAPTLLALDLWVTGLSLFFDGLTNVTDALLTSVFAGSKGSCAYIFFWFVL